MKKMRFCMWSLALMAVFPLAAHSHKPVSSRIGFVAAVLKAQQPLTDIEQAVLDRIMVLMKGDVSKESITSCRDEVCALFAKDAAYKNIEKALRAIDDLTPSLRLVGQLNSLLKILPPRLEQNLTHEFWNLPLRQRFYLFRVFLKRSEEELHFLGY